MPQRSCGKRRIALVGLLGVLSGWCWASLAEGGSPSETRYPVVVRVEKSFNGAPFEYRIESRVEGTNYAVCRVTYPSPLVTPLPQNNTVPAAYYLPRGMKPGDPKRPAVICMHILDGNDELMRMTCSMLASHGIPAISFKLPYYGERGPVGGPRVLADNPKLFLEALGQSMGDIRRTVDLLASRPEVDPEKIGIMGISLGGIISGSAAGMEPRLHRAMLILAGGDVLTIIHHARETRDLSRLIDNLSPEDRARVEQTIAAVDPLRQAAALRARAVAGQVLMVNAAQDEVIPKACTEKLADALGIRDKVAWLDGLGHYTAIAALPRVLDQMVAFFGEDLDPSLRVTPRRSSVKTPVEVVLRLVQQALGFLTNEPGTGRCHFAELTASITPKGQEKPLEGRLLMVRGTLGRFKLQCQLPMVGDVALGQGKYPWMASAKVLFKGVKNLVGLPGDPLAFADPRGMMRLRMATGAVSGALIAPEILDSLVAVAEDKATDGKRTVRLTLKGRNRGDIWLTLRADGSTPERLGFDVPGAVGEIAFRQWQINTVAPEAVFAPPTGLAEKEVDASELQRVFSALWNFAMENVQ